MDGRTAEWKRLLGLSLSGGIPRRSAKAAVVVGSLLNLINQGDTLFGVAELNVPKALLTFIVPYCVTTYGAVSVRLDRRRASGRDGAVDAG